MSSGTHPTHPAMLLVLTLLAVPPRGASAENAPDRPTPPSIFSEVIKQPTGKNGYEELVLAGEVLRSSKLFQQAEMGETTLAFKRRVVRDPPVIKSLTLLREGVAKPVFSPRERLTYTTLLPEMAPFRSLARLLRLQQYVFLADGRTTEAIANARLGLRLGRVIQTDTLISGLVGIAVSTISLRSMGGHLDQLSARDCELLYQVCLEWLNQPDPQLAILESERRSIRNALTDLKAEVKQKGAAAIKESFGLDDEQFLKAQSFLKELEARAPEALDDLTRQVEARVDEFFTRQLAELEKPPWQRAVVNPEALNNGSVVDWAAGMLLPAMSSVSDRYTREMAQVRLLACHCAIRRYRWEHEKLPPSLDELNLGQLALDPFTGGPLQYRVQGARYRLTSVGPVADAEDPQAENGRRPVSIVPGDF
jgi:hypothetical protein